MIFLSSNMNYGKNTSNQRLLLESMEDEYYNIYAKKKNIKRYVYDSKIVDNLQEFTWNMPIITRIINVNKSSIQEFLNQNFPEKYNIQPLPTTTKPAPPVVASSKQTTKNTVNKPNKVANMFSFLEVDGSGNKHGKPLSITPTSVGITASMSKTTGMLSGKQNTKLDNNAVKGINKAKSTNKNTANKSNKVNTLRSQAATKTEQNKITQVERLPQRKKGWCECTII